MKKYLRWPFYVVEVTFFSFIYITAKMLTFRQASHLGGFLIRHLGRNLKVNKIALMNLQQVYPTASTAFYNQVISEMWDNLGRTIFEYFNLSNQDPLNNGENYHIEGLQHLDQFINDNKPGFILTIHQANWEMGNFIALKKGLPLAQVTRFLNNPLMRKAVNYLHGQVAQEIIPKSAMGAKRIIGIIRGGGHVSMMMDQKLNEGIDIPFFGYPARTATAMARLAYKYQCPILPVQVVRFDKTKFRVIYHPPIEAPAFNDTKKAVDTVLRHINQLIEQWILEAPGQWFWVHKRYPKSFYKNKERP